MFGAIVGRYFRSSYWKDVLWQTSGNSVAQLIGIACIPVLTRLYTPEEFAIQNLLLQLVAFLAGIMTLRFEYFIQLPKNDHESVSLIALVLLLGLLSGIILTPLLVIFNTEIAFMLGNESLSSWIWLAPLTAALISYALAAQHWIQRKQRYQLSAFSEISGKATYASIGVAGAFLFTGPAGLMLAPIGSALGKLGLLVGSLSFRQSFGQKYLLQQSSHNVVATARSHWSASLSMVGSHLMFTITSSLPLIFIAHTYGAALLGQYALVITTVYLPAGLIGSAIGQVYYQRAANCQHLNESCSDLWSMTAKRLICIGIPMYLCIILLSPFVYPVLFGAEWKDAGLYASIVAVAAFFSFCSSPMDRSSLVAGIWWYPMFWHGLRAISTILVLYCAHVFNWTFLVLLSILVGQISCMYALDFLCGKYFATLVDLKIRDAS